MRIRTRGFSQKNLIAGVMGIVGVVILIVALPPQFLLALSGAGLVAGAWFLMKIGR